MPPCECEVCWASAFSAGSSCELARRRERMFLHALAIQIRAELRVRLSLNAASSRQTGVTRVTCEESGLAKWTNEVRARICVCRGECDIHNFIRTRYNICLMAFHRCRRASVRCVERVLSVLEARVNVCRGECDIHICIRTRYNICLMAFHRCRCASVRCVERVLSVLEARVNVCRGECYIHICIRTGYNICLMWHELYMCEVIHTGAIIIFPTGMLYHIFIRTRYNICMMWYEFITTTSLLFFLGLTRYIYIYTYICIYMYIYIYIPEREFARFKVRVV